ncbi:MAG: hypothetical protein GX364_09450 [Firmicutes bacterium]|nr:hypothetical protein [Bacillota bacterium]
MGKNFGSSSVARTILVLCITFMMVFSPVVAGAAPVIAAGGLGGGKAAAGGLAGKASTYFGSLFKGARSGDYDFEKEFAAMERAGKFADVNDSWQNFSAAALEDGQLADIFESAVIRLSDDDDIGALDELLLLILKDDELAIAIGEFIGGIILDDDIMAFAKVLVGDILDLLQDSEFKDFLTGFLKYVVVDDGDGNILIDDLFVGILQLVNDFAEDFLEDLEYKEFLDGLLEIVKEPFEEYFEGFMEDPDIEPTLKRILDNFSGIADEFLEELLEAEAFKEVVDGLLAVFLDPVMEHIVDDLIGKFADPDPDLVANPDAVPGHPLLGTLVTKIMDFLKFKMGSPCGKCDACLAGEECTVNTEDPIDSWQAFQDVIDALMDYLEEDPGGALTELLGQVDILMDAFMGSAIDIGGGDENGGDEGGGEGDEGEEEGVDIFGLLLGIDELVDQILGFVMGDDDSNEGSLVYHLGEILEEYMDEENEDGLMPFIDKYFKYDEEDPQATDYLGNISRTASAAVSAALDTLLDEEEAFWDLLKTNNFVVTDEDTGEESLGLGRLDEIVNLAMDKIKTELAEEGEPCGLSTCPHCGADPADPDNCENKWTADGRLRVVLDEALEDFHWKAERDDDGEITDPKGPGLFDLIMDHLDIFLPLLMDHISGEGEESGDDPGFGLIPWSTIASLLDEEKVDELVGNIFKMLEDLDADEIFDNLKESMEVVLQSDNPNGEGYYEPDPEDPYDYDGWVKADMIGHSLVRGILKGVAEGIEDPEPVEECPDCALLPEGELCDACKAAKEKADAREAAIKAKMDVLMGEDALKGLYVALGGRYEERDENEDGDPLYPFEKEDFEASLVSVVMAVVMEILDRDWPCGECDECTSGHPENCENPVNRLKAFTDKLKDEKLKEITEDEDVLRYGQRIAGAGLGVVDRVVAPMLKLLYPRFYGKEYDEKLHEMWAQMADEDYITDSLWRIGSTIGSLVTETDVYDFPDSVLYMFLNEFQVVEDIANADFFNPLTAFIADVMNDDDVKGLKAGYFGEDLRDTVLDAHADLKADFEKKEADEFADELNELIGGIFPDEPLVIKLYDDPCGECDGCLAAIDDGREPTYADCEHFQPCGECEACQADPPEFCERQWKTPADVVDTTIKEAVGEAGDMITDLIAPFLEYEQLVRMTEAPGVAFKETEARCGECTGCTSDPQGPCENPVNIREGFEELIEDATSRGLTLVSALLAAEEGDDDDLLLQVIIDELLDELLAANGPIDNILVDVGKILNDDVTSTALKQLIVDIVLFEGDVPCGKKDCPFCGEDPDPDLEECPDPDNRNLLNEVNTLLVDMLGDTEFLDTVIWMLEDALIEAAYGEEAYPLSTAYVEIAGIGLVAVSPEQIVTGLFNGLWAFFELLREWLIDEFQVMDEDTGLLSELDFNNLPEGHPFEDGYISLVEFIDGFLAKFLTEARIRGTIADPAIDTVLGIGGAIFDSTTPSLLGIIKNRIEESMYADSGKVGPIALIGELMAEQAEEESELNKLLPKMLNKVLDLVGDITETIDNNPYLVTGGPLLPTAGLLHQILTAVSEIAPDAEDLEAFIEDNRDDLIKIVEAVVIEIDLDTIKELLTISPEFSQMLIDVVTGTKVEGIFDFLGDFIYDEDEEELDESRGYKLGWIIQDLPGQFISSLLKDDELGEGVSEIIAEKLVLDENEYDIGKRVLNVVKTVVTNEDTAAILGDLLADGVRSLHDLFFGRIDPLTGFQKILNPASPGEIIGGAVESDYDVEMLQAMPSLGINTVLTAGGMEPQLQEGGAVQNAEVTSDDIIDAVMEMIEHMGTDLLYDDRLAAVIDVVLDDLLGEDRSKLSATMEDGKELLGEIIADERIKAVLGTAIGDLLGSDGFEEHIATLAEIIFDLLGDEDLVKDVIDVVTGLLADDEVSAFLTRLVSGDDDTEGVVQFVLDLVTGVLDELFVDDDTKVTDETMKVIENLIVFLVREVPAAIGDTIQGEIDNISGILGDVVTDVLKFVPDFAATLLGDDDFAVLVNEAIEILFDFLPGIIEGAATDEDIFALLAPSVADNVDLVNIGDVVVDVINDFLKDEEFNEKFMAPAFTYISDEAVKRADYRTPGDSWNVIIAGAKLNIMKLIAGILSGLPGDIVNTVVLNWLIYESGEPCGVCENCLAEGGYSLDCTDPQGADPEVDPDKPLNLGTISSWVGDIIKAVDDFRIGDAPDDEKLLFALLDRAGGFVAEFVPLLLAEEWPCGECDDCETGDPDDCQYKVTTLDALKNQLLNLNFADVATDIADNDLYMNCGVCDGCTADPPEECTDPIYIPARLVEVLFGEDDERTDFLDLLAEVAVIIKDEGALEPGELSLVDLLEKIALDVSELIPLAEVADYIANDDILVPEINAALPDIGKLVADIADVVNDEADTIVAIIEKLIELLPEGKIAEFLQEEKDFGDGEGDRTRASWLGENVSDILLGKVKDFMAEPRLTEVIIRALFDPDDGFLYRDGTPGKSLLMLLADWMESGGMYDFLDGLLRPEEEEEEPGEIIGGSVREAASGFFSNTLAGAFNWLADQVSRLTYVETDEDAVIGLHADGDEVDIPDAKLRAAIEFALILNGVEGELTEGDMKKLRGLSAVSRGITDLTGLEYAVNLEYLDLYGNEIEDLSPLKDLNNLESLSLGYNPKVTEAGTGALAGLTKLRILDLSCCGFDDINVLSNLTMLENLRLTGNGISDISPLDNLTNLERLYLSDNEIASVDDLAGLTALERLYLADNEIDDIDALENLTAMRYLDLSGNAITTGFDKLQGMTKMENLDLSGNNAGGKLANLVDMDQLRRLYLSGSSLGNADMAAITALTTLWELDVSDNAIATLGDLEDLNVLRTLDLSGNGSLGDLTALADLASLKDLSLAAANINNTKLDDITALDKVRYLDLSDNGLTLAGSDWSGMTALRRLNLAQNDAAANLDVLNGLALEELNLNENEITDISDLADVLFVDVMQGIRLLLTVLPDMSFDDISFQDRASGGGSLYLSGNSVANLAPLAGKQFHVLDLSANGLGTDDIGAIKDIEFGGYMGGGILDLSDNEIENLTAWIDDTVNTHHPLAKFGPYANLNALDILYLNGNDMGDVVSYNTKWRRENPASPEQKTWSIITMLEQAQCYIVYNAPVDGGEVGGGELEGLISGKVTDVVGEALAGATVTVQGVDQALLTAADGTFTTDALPAGTYTIDFRQAGYLPQELTVTLTGAGEIGVQEVFTVGDVALQLYGDVCNDGKVDVMDAIRVLRHVVKLDTLDNDAQQRAKVAGNDKVTVKDAILILQKIVNRINLFPAAA